MRRPLAALTLAALIFGLGSCPSAHARGFRRGHGGKHVIYNGSTFATQAIAPAPTTIYRPAYVPAGSYYVVPRPAANIQGTPPMMGGS